MKTKQLLIAISAISVLTSCSIEKRLYNNGYHVEWKKRNKSVDTDITQYSESNTNQVDENQLPISDMDELTPVEAVIEDKPCDNLVMKSGEEIPVIVEEVNESSIKYRKCDNQTGPLYVVDKSKVFMIKYSNGGKDVFNEESKANNTPESKTPDKQTVNKPSGPQTESAGAVGFTLGLISIPIWLLVSLFVGIPSGILSIILGAISLSKIKKNPEKFKGKGLGVMSIIIGVILIIASIVLIVALI